MNLIKRLNKLGADINERFPYINWGGCCVFASRVGRHLERIADSVVVRIGNDYGEWNANQRVDEIRPHIARNVPREWNKFGVHFAHVIIEFVYAGRKFHYDSLGVTKPDTHTKMGRYPLIAGGLTVGEATELCARQSGWNPCFDRDNIPAIEEMIENAFVEIEQALSAVAFLRQKMYTARTGVGEQICTPYSNKRLPKRASTSSIKSPSCIPSVTHSVMVWSMTRCTGPPRQWNTPSLLRP